MFDPRFMICLFLILFSADSIRSDTDADEDSIKNSSTEQIADITSSDVASNTSTDNENDGVKSSSTGAGHDIEITGHITPSSFSEETELTDTVTDHILSTEFETINDTSETTTENIEIQRACTLNPCKNYGTCIEDSASPYFFSCTCASGYVGIRCGTVDKCKVNEDGEICKSGACIYSQDGLLRSCQCFSGMYWDEIAKECRDPDPPCIPNPCMNGGTCSDKNGIGLCDCPFGYTGRNCSVTDKCGNCDNGTCVSSEDQTLEYCKCNEGLYWNEEQQACKIMTSPCDSNPCLNGGSCDCISDTEFNCSCQMGFSGKNCEIIDRCSEDKDCGHGACVLSNDGKLKTCQCDKGFYLEDQGYTCKEITNICQPNPCLNDGICTVVSTSSFNCTCSEGYEGKKCEIRNLCVMDGGNAFCGNGVCHSNNALGVYFCTCNEREYFQYVKRKCVELDMCPLVECESMERCIMGECKCKEHHKWNNDTQKCVPDFCSSNPCPLPEMLCEEGTEEANYKCYCPEGFSFNGTHCNEAVCIFPKLNPCNQLCSQRETGYQCSCVEEFEMKEDNHTCTYIGNATCSNKTCHKGFCLQDSSMEVRCICPPGFTEIDGQCKDVCTSGNIPSGICPSDECESSSDTEFRCKCDDKFALSKDKSTCMVRNICDTNEIGWKTCTERNAKCERDWYSMNGYNCPCSNGQVPTDGGICRDICSLEINQRHCSIKGATCDVDDKGMMYCKCPPYFKENGREGKCTRPADFSYLITLPLDKSTYLSQNRKKRSLNPLVDYRKISLDVTVTLREMFSSFSQANTLLCKITSDYISCKIEVQFASESELELKRLQTGDICLGKENGNACLLPPTLILVKNKISENVRIQRTDPCDEEIKNEVCGPETTCISSPAGKGFNCSCKPGFFARRKNFPFGDTRSFIELCSDIDECSEANPCPVNSNCKNTVGSYICSCKPGYRSILEESGIGSQKCVEVCHPNPCTHGHCSRRGDHEFDCKCDAGFAGRLCDLQDENFKSARINTIIVGVVLGGALLITFILFAACISRLRKKKILENSGNMYYSSTEMTERRQGEGGAVNNAFQRE